MFVGIAKGWRFVLEGGSAEDRRTQRCCAKRIKFDVVDDGRSGRSRWFGLINIVYSRAPVPKRMRLAPSNVLDPSRRLLTCEGNDGTRLHKFQID